MFKLYASIAEGHEAENQFWAAYYADMAGRRGLGAGEGLDVLAATGERVWVTYRYNRAIQGPRGEALVWIPDEGVADYGGAVVEVPRVASLADVDARRPINKRGRAAGKRGPMLMAKHRRGVRRAKLTIGRTVGGESVNTREVRKAIDVGELKTFDQLPRAWRNHLTGARVVAPG